MNEFLNKTDGIKNIKDINSGMAEGKLLIMAIARLTCTIYTDKTPDEVLGMLVDTAQTIDW